MPIPKATSFFAYLQSKYNMVVSVPKIETFSHKMDDPKKNREMFEDVYEGSGDLVKKIAPEVELRLYDTAIALLDLRAKALRPVAFHYLFDIENHLGKSACVEKFIWKDQSSALKDARIDSLRVPQFAFFYLVDLYKALVSDQIHSEEGSVWWANTVGKALKRDLNVFAENAESSAFVKVSSEAQLQKLHKFLWGGDDKFTMRLLTIAQAGYYQAAKPS